MKRMLLFFSIFLVVFACGKKDSEVKETKREEIQAKTFVVSKVTKDDFYEVSGTVVSRNPVNIVSKTMGTVTAINAEEGSFVKRGELLISLESPEIKASLERAQSAISEAEKALEMAKTNYQFAENTYKRYEGLYKERAISQQEFENIQTKRDIALNEVKRVEASLAQAKAEKMRVEGMASYLKIFSPVDGVVTSKQANLGMNIMPGMPLLTIETLDKLRIEVNADEKIFPIIKKGMLISVSFDSIKRDVKGVLNEYIPAIDSLSRTFKMKIDLPKDNLITIGMYGTVKIPMGKVEKILIPKSAIVVKGQLTYVYVLDDKNVASMRLVRVGKEEGDYIEIISGIQEKDRIVETVNEKIKDGVVIRG